MAIMAHHVTNSVLLDTSSDCLREATGVERASLGRDVLTWGILVEEASAIEPHRVSPSISAPRLHPSAPAAFTASAARSIRTGGKAESSLPYMPALLPVALLILLLTAFLSASPASPRLLAPRSTSCSSLTAEQACTTAESSACLWAGGCCHSATVTCVQDPATLQCSAGCASCGLHGCYPSVDTCPAACNTYASKDACNSHGWLAAGTRCAWSDNAGSCVTVIAVDSSVTGTTDARFVSAAAGIISRTRQAAMLSMAESNGKSGALAVVPDALATDPTVSAAAVAPNGAVAGTPVLDNSASSSLLPPAAVSNAPTTPPKGVSPGAPINADTDSTFSGAFTLNGSKSSGFVIAGIVIGVVAVVGIMGVVVHRRVQRRRAAAAIGASAHIPTTAIPRPPPLVPATSSPGLQHGRNSLLGWLQHAVRDVPPPSPASSS